MIHRMKKIVAPASDGNRPFATVLDSTLYAMAWAVPILLVAFGVGMSHRTDDFMDYGLDGVCWMSWKHRGIIYLFIAPSGIALFINIILVIATLICLIQIRSTQSSLLRPRGLAVECIFGIMARISVILGAEWMLGMVLYLIPNSVVMQYTFVLVIGLRGIWLLISTLTLGVWRKLRDRMKVSFLQLTD